MSAGVVDPTALMSIVDVNKHGANANVEARKRVEGIQQKACPAAMPAPS